MNGDLIQLIAFKLDHAFAHFIHTGENVFDNGIRIVFVTIDGGTKREGRHAAGHRFGQETRALRLLVDRLTVEVVEQGQLVNNSALFLGHGREQKRVFLGFDKFSKRTLDALYSVDVLDCNVPQPNAVEHGPLRRAGRGDGVAAAATDGLEGVEALLEDAVACAVQQISAIAACRKMLLQAV